MKFTTASAAAVLLATSAMAAPAAEKRGAAYTVEQVKNPMYNGRNGAIAMEKTFKKYGKEVPSFISEAAARAREGSYAIDAGVTGSITATPQSDDSEYLCTVQIGTPAQNVLLDFDTGSSDLWVITNETPSSEVKNNQAIFNIPKSSTAKKMTGATWDITYGDGSSCSGDVYTDKVTVGGVTVTSQAVESAETLSTAFQSGALSGLLGLAYSKLNTVSPTKQNTWFANAASQLSSYVMTADLKYHTAGKYNFGYIDSTAYTGSISYVSVNQANGFWEFTATGYAYGSGSMQSASIDAIADTGTTLIYLPKSIADGYWATVPSASYSSLLGGWTFTCTATLPSFSFKIGTYTGTVPGSYINYAPALGSKCFGGIQRNTGIGISIFGDVALKSAFVVFDGGNNRLGWASKNL